MKRIPHNVKKMILPEAVRNHGEEGGIVRGSLHHSKQRGKLI